MIQVDEISSILGVCDGLRSEVAPGAWSCGKCGKIHREGSIQIWVPTGIRNCDPAWSVTEMSEQEPPCGLWCVSCAPKQGNSQPIRLEADLWHGVARAGVFLMGIFLVIVAILLLT